MGNFRGDDLSASSLQWTPISQPRSAPNGFMWFNVSDNNLYLFVGSTVTRITGGSNPNFADAIVPSGTIDGSNEVFTLPNVPNPSLSLQLFLNGILMTEGLDYNLSGSTITYSGSLPQIGNTHICWFRY